MGCSSCGQKYRLRNQNNRRLQVVEKPAAGNQSVLKYSNSVDQAPVMDVPHNQVPQIVTPPPREEIVPATGQPVSWVKNGGAVSDLGGSSE